GLLPRACGPLARKTIPGHSWQPRDYEAQTWASDYILLKLFFDRIKGSNLVGFLIELGKPSLSVRPDTHAVREILCRSREISEGCVRGFITNVHMMDLLLSWNRGVGTKNFLQTGTDIVQLFVRQVRDEKYRAHSGDK